MKTKLFKRTKTLLAIGFALFTSITLNSLNANVFAAEENLIEYVNSDTKFSFEDFSKTTYEFSLIKQLEESALPDPSEKQIANAKTIGIQFVESTKTNQTLSWESITTSKQGELTASEIEFSHYLELSRIINKHLYTDEKQLLMYDLQNDGVIDVRDIVALENRFYSCPTNFLIINGQKMSLEVFSGLLSEHKNNNEVSFKIYATDKPNIIETTNTEITVDTTAITTLETSMTKENSSETENVSTSIVTTTPGNEESTELITTTVTEPQVTTLFETTTKPETTTNPIITVPEEITVPETTVSDETIPEETTLPETTVTTGLPLDPDGWEIETEIYNSLVESAKLFGIDNYKIVWTEKEVLNSIVYIDSWFASAYSLQQNWAIQLCSIEEIERTNTEFQVELGLHGDNYNFTHFVWRPSLKGDWQDEKFGYNEYRCDIIFIENHIWKYLHWCLIPLDENGNEDLRIWYNKNNVE